MSYVRLIVIIYQYTAVIKAETLLQINYLLFYYQLIIRVISSIHNGILQTCH